MMSIFTCGRLAATLGIALAASTGNAATPVALPLTDVVYTENFNSLVASGTGSTTPAGWGFEEGGQNGNTTYAAGDGSSNTGNTYSFGAGANTDRAFGTLRSGNLIPFIGAFFTNGLGSTITSLAIDYSGEQYRLGSASRTDRLDFQISFDATTLQDGTWTNVDALDFASIVTTGSPRALYASSTVSGVIGDLAIADGSRFAIRFFDFDASGADDALAIDDFRMIATTAGAVPEPATWAMMILGFGLVGGAMRRRAAKAAFAA